MYVGALLLMPLLLAMRDGIPPRPAVARVTGRLLVAQAVVGAIAATVNAAYLLTGRSVPNLWAAFFQLSYLALHVELCLTLAVRRIGAVTAHLAGAVPTVPAPATTA